MLAYLWILNLLLIVDWAKNRRQPFWLPALVLFGPLGAAAYIIYYYESINFPIELAKTVRRLTGKKVVKACPRCGEVAEIKAHQDGRQLHYMCQSCIELTFAQGETAMSAVEMAADIVREAGSRQPEAPPVLKESEPEAEPEPVSEFEAELEIWSVPSAPFRFPDEVEHGLQKLLKLEKRYGAEMGRSPSLQQVVAIQGQRAYSTEITAEKLKELFELAQETVGGELKKMDWGPAWNAEQMRKSIVSMNRDETLVWLKKHVLQEFAGARGAPTKKSRKANEDRDQKLDLLREHLESSLAEETTLFFVNDCENEMTQEAVYALVSGRLLLFWVNTWVL